MTTLASRRRAVVAVVAVAVLGAACGPSDGGDDHAPVEAPDAEIEDGPPEPPDATASPPGTDDEPPDATGDDLADLEPDPSAGALDVDQVELASTWCADLPRAPHPDLGDDLELRAALACLYWVDALEGAGYAPVRADEPPEADEVDALFAQVRQALDGQQHLISRAREEAAELTDRRDSMIAAARTIVAVGDAGEVTGNGGDEAGERDETDGYRSRVLDLPAELVEDMRASTWREGCPVHLDELRLVEVVHHGFDGEQRWGQLVVHAEVATDVASAFGEHHAAGFPIERIEPIERYGGDDEASMAANNTSAFNCRAITGSDRWSEHAYGWAIDINPVQNPYVRGGTVLPESGREYLDRSEDRPGMLTRPGAVEVWDELGWGWGGDWNSLKDHQHVSLTGR